MKGFTKKSIWVPCVVVGLLLIVLLPILLIGSWVGKRTSLVPYLKQIQPGMTYDQVRKIIPPQFIISEKEPCWNIVMNAWVVYTSARAASEIYLGAPPRDVSLIEAALVSGESGRVYFDKDDKIIGIYYNTSSAGRWSPRWGVKYDGRIRFPEPLE